MAELVDALVSGTSVRKYVQVRVLLWAPFQDTLKSKKSVFNLIKSENTNECSFFFKQVSVPVESTLAL